jgi:eukaryotic-like serine/threonine-protein kinase
MPLGPGTRLGPYEIVVAVGAGGMGEVYRARDTRLGREVAIKVLPAQFAVDPEWRQRLDREARAISSLSHPHICHLYDVGHDDGVDFLVMEYLEGETLADRLARGALAVDQVVRYGNEIAGALHSAHRKGLVHRDLKPGNVMLTRTGARLLDFGLAKPSPASAAAAGMTAATTSAPLTAKGTLVGTFQYMSPEQVEGREADARSDIFALGAVLYEMATGRRAFDGKSTASVIAAILERDPPAVSSLQPLAPATLDDLVRGCLAKDPEERWQTAHDVGLQLQALGRQLGTVTAGPLPARAGWRRAAVALAALMLVLAAVLAVRLAGPPSQAPVLLRASLLPPAAHSFAPYEFAVAPDGQRLAFVATAADGVSALWVQSLDSPQPTQISGSAGAAFPFWSPDSRWIAFYAGGKLMKVELGGGGPQAVADALARGGAWNHDGVILYSSSVFGPLLRVDANGGTPRPVTSIPLETAGEAHRFPQFLRDGRRFLYVISWTTQQRGGVYLGSLDGGEPRLVSSDIRGRMLLVNDHLLFLRGGIMYAQPFDDRRGELTGTARPVLRNELATDWRFGDVPFSASSNGVLVFQSRLSYNSRLVWYDRNGQELGAVGTPGFGAPAISPDGRRIAAALDNIGAGEQSLWIHDLHRNISTRLTQEGTDTAHAWSGDGRFLAYSSHRAVNGLFRRPADGSGSEETLLESPAHLLVNGYSADDRRLLYMDFSHGAPELRSYNFESRQIESLGGGAEGSFSPDGKWLAYVGLMGTLLVQRLGDAGAGRVQLAATSGAQLRWRGDTREIFFVGPDKKMMAVPLTERDGTLEPGTAVPLFQTRIVQPRLVLFQYDVTPDGQRFLVNSLPSEDAAAPLSMIVNWTEELRR